MTVISWVVHEVLYLTETLPTFGSVYFVKERESTSGGGAWEREGDRESQADFMPSAEPNAGLDLADLRDHNLSQSQESEA